MANPLLTKDKKRLTVFSDGITIDPKLPKWKNAGERISNQQQSGKKIVTRQTTKTPSGTVATMSTPFAVYSTPENYDKYVEKTPEFIRGMNPR